MRNKKIVNCVGYSLIKKKKLIATLIVMAFVLSIQGQNIAITDDNGYAADPSAMLDVQSTSKGMLIPRLTSAQRNSIANPAGGLLVFDINEDNFYFHNGTGWISLSSQTNSIWSESINGVFLQDASNKVGVGTNNPIGKLEVQGDVPLNSMEPLFEVLNSNGDTVFAVYSTGVRINVDDGGVKNTKASGNRGGFAVGGFSQAKGIAENGYMWVTPDSVRIYIDDNGGQKATGSKGGFAVGGFSQAKALPTDYFNISGADSAEVILSPEARVMWYPAKEAFLSGKVIIQSVDSVGLNSMATGNQSKAIGANSQAFGNQARAGGDNSTAIGNNADARAINSIAIGQNSIASGNGAYAFGSSGTGQNYSGPTIAAGNNSFAIGRGARALNTGSFAFGTAAYSNGVNSVAIGPDAGATAEGAVALGNFVSAGGHSSLATGYDSWVSGFASGVFGYNCGVSGDYSMSQGQIAYAQGSNSRAFGFNSWAVGDHTTIFGNDFIVSGNNSFGIALSSQAMLDITCPNVMAIMGGKVGVNTACPIEELQVTGLTDNASILISPKTSGGGTTSSLKLAEDASFNDGMELKYDGASDKFFIIPAVGGVQNTFPFTLQASDGNIGMGTTAPQRTLHIKQSTSGQGIRLEKVAAANYWDIGTGGNNNFQFYYNGTLMADIGSGTGAYNQLSDRRKKKNIEALGSVLDKVIMLKPVRFQYKTEQEDATKSYGFIAQDVELIFPDMISYFHEGGKTFKGLSYDNFAVLAIQSLIDLNQKLDKDLEAKNMEISGIKAENEQLRKQYFELRSEIDQIKSTLEISSKK